MRLIATSILVLLTALGVEAATVQGNIADLFGKQNTVKVAITPVAAPISITGSNIVTGTPRNYTATNGLMSVSMAAGSYAMQVAGVDDIYITVPDSTNTFAIGDLVVGTVGGTGVTGQISTDAYGPGWDGVTNRAPTLDAVYDKIESFVTNTISDTAYGASWNGATNTAPTQNAVYDKIESLVLAGGGDTLQGGNNTFTGANVFTPSNSVVVTRAITNHNVYRDGAFKVMLTTNYTGTLSELEYPVVIQAGDAVIANISDTEGSHGSTYQLLNAHDTEHITNGWNFSALQPSAYGVLRITPNGTNTSYVDAEGDGTFFEYHTSGQQRWYGTNTWLIMQDIDGTSGSKTWGINGTGNGFLRFYTLSDDLNTSFNPYYFYKDGAFTMTGTDPRPTFYKTDNSLDNKRTEFIPYSDRFSLAFGQDVFGVRREVVQFMRSGTNMSSMIVYGDITTTSNVNAGTFLGNLSWTNLIDVPAGFADGTDDGGAGGGDFMADGSVAMTGTLNLNGQVITNAGGLYFTNASGSVVAASGQFTNLTIVTSGTAPTPAEDDNSTKIATTAYVQTELADVTSGTTYSNLTETGYTVTANNLTVSTNFTISGTSAGSIKLNDGQSTEAASKFVALFAPPTVTNSYALMLPNNTNANGYLYATWESATNATLSFAIPTSSGVAVADIDSSLELRNIVSDESGSGALLFAGGDIGAATATTPSGGDSDTSVATTAFVATGFQPLDADLTALAGNDGSSLTNMLGATNAYQLVNLSQLQSAIPSGRVAYFTSSEATGFTLTGTVKATNYAGPDLPTTAWTNTAVTSANGEYIAAFASTNVFKSLASGLSVVDVYCYEDTAGSGSISAELYLINSVTGAEEYEFTPSPPAQAVPSTLTKLTFSIPVTDYTSTTNLRPMVKIKVTESSTPDPTIRIVGGGAYASHVSFPIPGATYLTKVEAASGYQPLAAPLTALAGNANLYQSSNSVLTTVAGIGAGSSGQLIWHDGTRWTNSAANPFQATNAALTALAANANLYQSTNANLTTLAGASITGSGNFMRTRTGVPREIWIPASAMNPSASGGAAASTNAWATTTDGQTLECFDFDASSDESTQVTFLMPDAWDGGTVKAKFVWKQVTASSATNVWGIVGGSANDNEAGGNTLGTAVTLQDVGLNDTNKVAITAATSALTIGGTPAAGHLVWFKVYRDADATEDNMANDARLIGVRLQYTETTTEPSAW